MKVLILLVGIFMVSNALSSASIQIKPTEALDTLDLKSAFSFLNVEYQAYDLEYADPMCLHLSVLVRNPDSVQTEHGRGCLCSKPGQSRLMVLLKQEDQHLLFRFAHRSGDLNRGSRYFY